MRRCDYSGLFSVFGDALKTHPRSGVSSAILSLRFARLSKARPTRRRNQGRAQQGRSQCGVGLEEDEFLALRVEMEVDAGSVRCQRMIDVVVGTR